jgi:endogenous inhibitor of DNA gyrase (YacG/DUF329 family)
LNQAEIEEQLLEKGFYFTSFREDGAVKAIHKHKNEYRSFMPTTCPECGDMRLVALSSKYRPKKCNRCYRSGLRVPGVWWGEKTGNKDSEK